MNRRRLLLQSLPGLLMHPALANANGSAQLAALRTSGVLLLRHAQTEAGIGDPPGFRLDDCSTQRNLSEAGRRQARSAGESLRRAGIRFDRVVSSAWCRCIDTATLMCPDMNVDILPALNSLFAGQGDREAQTAALRAWLGALPQAHTVLAVTHQVNVLALTGVNLSMGEAVLLRPGDASASGAATIRF